MNQKAKLNTNKEAQVEFSKQVKSKSKTNFLAWIGLPISIVIVVFLVLWKLNQILYDLPVSAAEFGDSFGMANTFFSALAFAFLIVTAIMQRKELQLQRLELSQTHKELKKSYVGQVVINLFNEFRNEKAWIEARKLVAEAKKDKEIDYGLVRDYSHFLNHFGFLLEHDYVDIESLYETFGKSVMDFWRLVKPTIYELRNSNGPKEEYYPYQYHLEYLDYRLRKYYPTGRKKIENLLDEIRIWNLKEETVSINSNL